MRWAANFGGTLQMDLSYATIPTCEGMFVTLHRELAYRYHVEDPKDPVNELVYYEKDIGNYAILGNSIAPDEEIHEDECNKVWRMNFDRPQSRSGAGVGIVFTFHEGDKKSFSYQLEFECTNNVAKYEAFFFVLEMALDMGIKHLQVIGDLDLIIFQVKR
jgi:hypothetical protein